MTNDFLPFAIGGGANVEPQSTYASDSLRTNGNQPGIAVSAFNNKALRQANAIASQFAQYIANTTGQNVVDDGNMTNLLAQLTTALTPTYPIQYKTSAYTVVPTDSLILCSTNPFILSLYDVTTAPSKRITIKKTDANLANFVTIMPFAGQTVNGLATYILYTLGETVTFEADATGLNWVEISHKTKTGWINVDTGFLINFFTFNITSGSATIGATYTNNSITFTVAKTVSSGTTVIMSGSGNPLASGTLTKASGTGDATLTFSSFTGSASTLSATTTAPVFYGSPSNNTYQYMRDGNEIILSGNFDQTVAGASAGSGDIIWPMPMNTVIDTSIAGLFTGGTAQTGLQETTAHTPFVQPAWGNYEYAGSASAGALWVIPYTNTSFRNYMNYAYNGSEVSQGSTFMPANAIVAFNWRIRLPVLNWQP
jgi:hypothetical protein